MLNEYELPPLDESTDDELKDYMLRRKSSFPDSDV
jgi:trimethylamine:corrinoid methyltransferase-like protein